MTEHHVASEAGQLSMAWTEIVERQRAAKERAAQRYRSWTVQNKMRGVLERLSTGSAGRILDSANL